MKMLGDHLRDVDKALSRLTAKRLSILDQIAKLDAEDGASERQTASRVARLSASTPKQAAAELATAKQVSAFPKLAQAHANGEISNGQLGAVASIASASSESEALNFAKTATSSQLQQRASTSRGKLFEERRKAHCDRYLGFKPEEGGQSVRIHGRLPFAESQQLESQLRKIADRLNQCDKDRPSPSARMADALLILTNCNASQAVHEHLNSKQRNAEQANSNAINKTENFDTENTKAENTVHAGAERSARGEETNQSNGSRIRMSDSPVNPKSNGNAISSGNRSVNTNRIGSEISDGEGTLSSEIPRRTAPLRATSQMESASAGTISTAAREFGTRPNLRTTSPHTSAPVIPFDDYDEEPFPETSAEGYEQSGFHEEDEEFTLGIEVDPSRASASPSRPVVVQRADTRLIIPGMRKLVRSTSRMVHRLIIHVFTPFFAMHKSTFNTAISTGYPPV